MRPSAKSQWYHKSKQALAMTIAARYEDGVFKPITAVNLKDGTRVEVRLLTPGDAGYHRPALRALPFFGLWADRTDIKDGIGYVNNLRDNPRE